ncbi:MAG: DUF429 domain-containing protein [Rhodospirillaceae bacterium]|nr:DUF429 domain-containing protein [Rhodospirillaceae bacterium]
MRLIGIDFTSSPSSRKAIAIANGYADDCRVRVESVCSVSSFIEFESVLNESGPWVAGCDFPFGQSRRFVEQSGLGATWIKYARRLTSMTRTEFRDFLKAYRQPRPYGDKEHKRITDILTGAASSQKIENPPVGLMFYEGVKRLLAANISVVPVAVTQSNRIAVETYPALIARTLVGKAKYKAENSRDQTRHLQLIRQNMLRQINSDGLRQSYGLGVSMTSSVWEAAELDGSGDTIDAVMCLIQAGWAYTRSGESLGIPETCDKLEGWIVDPCSLRSLPQVPGKKRLKTIVKSAPPPLPADTAEKVGMKVQIRDHVIWFRHISGPSDLKSQISNLKSGAQIKLLVDGYAGNWQRMNAGPSGAPVDGLKPIADTKKKWADLQSRRGEWVEIKIAQD